MEYDIKKLTVEEAHSWADEHTELNIENKYVNKLETYLSAFGFKPISEGPGGRGSEMSIKDSDGYKYYFDLTSSDRYVSFEVRQYEDDWFILSYWENFGKNSELFSIYVCDQFDAVLYQLNICMRDLPKINDTKWNKDIDDRIDLEKQKKKVIDIMNTRIMSFSRFDLDNFKQINNINETFKTYKRKI